MLQILDPELPVRAFDAGELHPGRDGGAQQQGAGAQTTDNLRYSHSQA